MTLINQFWHGPEYGLERALAGLPGSMPEGEVHQIASGGSFGYMIEARLDRIDDRIALEVLTNSRMSGDEHYRVWEDGSKEALPTPRMGYLLPRECSREEERRIREAYFEENRAVGRVLEERGFGSWGRNAPSLPSD